MPNKLTSFISLVALFLSIIALGLVVARGDDSPVVTGNHCVNCDEVMMSIADSFRMNRLDFELHWSTPGEVHAYYGWSETATLP